MDILQPLRISMGLLHSMAQLSLMRVMFLSHALQHVSNRDLLMNVTELILSPSITVALKPDMAQMKMTHSLLLPLLLRRRAGMNKSQRLQKSMKQPDQLEVAIQVIKKRERFFGDTFAQMGKSQHVQGGYIHHIGSTRGSKFKGKTFFINETVTNN
jgi:hypothetical protein